MKFQLTQLANRPRDLKMCIKVATRNANKSFGKREDVVVVVERSDENITVPFSSLSTRPYISITSFHFAADQIKHDG